MRSRTSDLSAQLAILTIDAYRNTLSHLLLHSCKFFPSCSQYASEAIGMYGFVQGSWRALRRLCRCHPFSAGGFDPV